MLTAVLDRLRCPHCGSALHERASALVCARGHSFDIARQGYVNLRTGGATTTDTAAMVSARSEFLRAGHFDPISGALASVVAESATGPGLVVDIGGGTGRHSARVLADTADRYGLVVDISKYAARQAARAHPRLAAVISDVWAGIPLQDGSASVVLNVFAPRNGAELRRIIRPDGILVVVTPNGAHLTELVDRFGLLRVDERKQERLAEQLETGFTETEVREVAGVLPLDRTAIGHVIDMGPNAWHRNSTTLAAELAAVPEPFPVTFSVSVRVYRPR